MDVAFSTYRSVKALAAVMERVYDLFVVLTWAGCGPGRAITQSTGHETSMVDQLEMEEEGGVFPADEDKGCGRFDLVAAGADMGQGVRWCGLRRSIGYRRCDVFPRPTTEPRPVQLSKRASFEGFKSTLSLHYW